jgi:hypothetical protein
VTRRRCPACEKIAAEIEAARAIGVELDWPEVDEDDDRCACSRPGRVHDAAVERAIVDEVVAALHATQPGTARGACGHVVGVFGGTGFCGTCGRVVALAPAPVIALPARPARAA